MGSFTKGSTVRIGVLGSTRGTDLQAILDAIDVGRLDAAVTCVISDRKKAYILERAEIHHIPAHFVSAYTGPKGNRTRKERAAYDRDLSMVLSKYGIDIILLIGYMRILSPEFCREWEGRILNVHPSLLPDFAGGMDSDVHQAVIDAGRQESGCTVHLATEELDEGPIVIQKRCPVLQEDTPETLKQKVQSLEGEALIEAVELFRERGSFT